MDTTTRNSKIEAMKVALIESKKSRSVRPYSEAKLVLWESFDSDGDTCQQTLEDFFANPDKSKFKKIKAAAVYAPEILEAAVAAANEEIGGGIIFEGGKKSVVRFT